MQRGFTNCYKKEEGLCWYTVTNVVSTWEGLNPQHSDALKVYILLSRECYNAAGMMGEE